VTTIRNFSYMLFEFLGTDFLGGISCAGAEDMNIDVVWDNHRLGELECSLFMHQRRGEFGDSGGLSWCDW
jgi:hypothetical protein